VERDEWGWPRRESDVAFAAVGDRVIDAIRQLRRLSPPLQRSVYTVSDRELTSTQVDALEVLDTRGTWRMHEVAAKLGVDQSTATRTLAPLVDLGLVARAPDPLDRRYVVVGVTPTGHRRSEVIAEARRSLMREVIGQMEPSRRRLFADLLEEYVRAHAAPSADAEDA
jgi:DNA-binding MarR family transcriptional regulator